MADLKAIVNTLEWLSYFLCRSEALLIAYIVLAAFLIDGLQCREL
jgi:hypothetical protein